MIYYEIFVYKEFFYPAKNILGYIFEALVSNITSVLKLKQFSVFI
jgi:hypothetical protein